MPARSSSTSTGHSSQASTLSSRDSFSTGTVSTRILNRFSIGSKVTLDLCLTHPVFWGTLCPRGCPSNQPSQSLVLSFVSLSLSWRPEPHLGCVEVRDLGPRHLFR